MMKTQGVVVIIAETTNDRGDLAVVLNDQMSLTMHCYEQQVIVETSYKDACELITHKRGN